MSRTLRSNATTIQSSRNNNLILAIVTKKANEVRSTINSTNVNDVIDTGNNFRAIHYAVSVKKNGQIIEYLLACGANVYAKYDDIHDALDMSVDNNYRTLFDHVINTKNVELDDICKKLDNRTIEMQKIKNTCIELKTLNNNYINKLDELKNDKRILIENIESLKEDNFKYKRKYDDSVTAFNNLLKQQRK